MSLEPREWCLASEARLVPAHKRRFLRSLGCLGESLFTSLIAHIPINSWALWIPARFGFSDATEVFVFCSGMASPIAFGRVFDRAGWRLGTSRIALRVWQVYWAHIAIIVLPLTLMVGLDTAFGEERYVRPGNRRAARRAKRLGLIRPAVGAMAAGAGLEALR